MCSAYVPLSETWLAFPKVLVSTLMQAHFLHIPLSYPIPWLCKMLFFFSFPSVSLFVCVLYIYVFYRLCGLHFGIFLYDSSHDMNTHNNTFIILWYVHLRSRQLKLCWRDPLLIGCASVFSICCFSECIDW